jgi:hypothetical protein
MLCPLNTPVPLPSEAGWQQGLVVQGDHELFGTLDDAGQFTFTRPGTATFLVVDGPTHRQVQLTAEGGAVMPRILKADEVLVAAEAVLIPPTDPDQAAVIEAAAAELVVPEADPPPAGEEPEPRRRR